MDRVGAKEGKGDKTMVGLVGVLGRGGMEGECLVCSERQRETVRDREKRSVKSRGALLDNNKKGPRLTTD